jgi:hypothetical protein
MHLPSNVHLVKKGKFFEGYQLVIYISLERVVIIAGQCLMKRKTSNKKSMGSDSIDFELKNIMLRYLKGITYPANHPIDRVSL